MKLSRETALKIHYILDQLLPPVLRDSKWFMQMPLKMLYKDKAEIFFNFKKKAHLLTEEEFAQAYKDVEPVLMDRETDLTNESINEVLREIKGETVLEVGCGKGLLASKLSQRNKVTAVDIIIDPIALEKYPQVNFAHANIEQLPFPDSSFDTVVCAHTLEHVRDIHSAYNELKRVAKNRLIIIVPRQRPYKYTFDLHLNFFPYIHSLNAALGVSPSNARCEEISGDLKYVEDFEEYT
ncbi:MAG: class I SAM-dependent methyltransferase [Patescibacteria group bacterium]